MQQILIYGDYTYNEILSILHVCEIKCHWKWFQCDLYSKLQLLFYTKISKNNVLPDRTVEKKNH